jgi:hypothetical protein
MFTCEEGSGHDSSSVIFLTPLLGRITTERVA